MKGLKRNFWRFFKRFWPLGLLVLVVLAFFWKVILKGQVPLPGDFVVGVYYPWLDYKWGFAAGVPVKNPITTDVVSFIYPMQILAMGMLTKGILPLWNPYILAGSPLLANMQSAPFSPTGFLYFIFDGVSAWSIQVILQHVLAAVFTYFLLRHWRVSRPGSVIGGIIFAFSGFNLIFSQWKVPALSAAFIPLVLLLEDRLLEKSKVLDGVLLSIALALQIFSGYPQISLYTAFAVAILWLVRIIKDKKAVVKTLILVVFCVLGVGLSSPQIFPSVELIKNSQRDFEPHSAEWAFLPWEKTITFIAPDYFGNHSTGNYWGPQDYTSNTGYVGVVAFILGIIAVFNIRRNRAILFLTILSVLSLLLSFATPLSVFLWSNNILGMRSSSAYRATVLFGSGMALLAGFGFDLISDKINNYKKKTFSLAITAVLVAFFAFYAYLNRSKAIFGESIFAIAVKNLILPLGVFSTASLIILFKPKLKLLLVPIAVLELFYFGFKFTPFSPRSFVYPETPVITFLKSQKKPFRTTGAKVIPSNLRMVYQIESLEGYDTLHPLGISRFIAAVNSGLADSNPTGRYGIIDNDTSPLLDLVNVKYYIALKNDGDIKRFDRKRFDMVFEDKSVEIFESKSVLPRAFMVYDWDIESDDAKALGKLIDPKFPLAARAIVSQDPGISRSYSGVTNSVFYKEYSEQKNLIEVETQKDGLLFISDAYYPGWKAYVDGKESKIFKADSVFRGIAISPGKHEVEMVYRPESFYAGLKVFGVSLAVLTLLLLRLRRYT